MISTVLGRIQTKVLTYPLLGVITALFVWLGGPIYWYAFAVTVLVGLLLEIIWGLIVEYQPGYLTIVFGLVEFLAVVAVVTLFSVPMLLMAALIYYITAWSIIQLFLIYILPVWRTCWSDCGGELWE